MIGGLRPRRHGLGDRYHRYIDRRIRAEGGPDNGSQFLFELDGRLDPALLRARLDGLPGPWTAVPLRVEEGDLSAADLFNRWFSQEFPRPDSEEPLHVILHLRAASSLLLLRWSHTLMDAPGADLLLQMLDGQPVERFRLHDDPPTLWRRVAGPGIWRPFFTLHLAAASFLRGALRPSWRRSRVTEGPPQQARFLLLDVDQTRRVDAHAALLAGPLEANHYLLACAARAAGEVLGAGPSDRVLLPCPMDVRPRAWRGPVFANYFSSVILRLTTAELADPRRAVGAAREQFRAALAEKQDVLNLFVMGLARFLPYVGMRLLIEGPGLRDPSTLYYSKVDLSVGRSGTLLGLPLRSWVIASSVLPDPGVTVLYSRCGDRLCATVVGSRFGREQELLDRVVALLLGGAAPESPGP